MQHLQMLHIGIIGSGAQLKDERIQSTAWNHFELVLLTQGQLISSLPPVSQQNLFILDSIWRNEN